MILTPVQHDYVYAMRNGTQTSNELRDAIGRGRSSVYRQTSTLRDMGLLWSTLRTIDGVQQYHHTLTYDYNEIMSRCAGIKNVSRTPITPEEIEYAVELVKSGLTGQTRHAQFQKRYPNRTLASLKGIIMRARSKRMCR